MGYSILNGLIEENFSMQRNFRIRKFPGATVDDLSYHVMQSFVKNRNTSLLIPPPHTPTHPPPPPPHTYTHTPELIKTHNYLVRKRTLNHLAKLAKFTLKCVRDMIRTYSQTESGF